MKCAILSIGNELIEGFVLNSNATYFSKKLNEIGFKVIIHLTIADEEQEIIDAINDLKNKVDIVIVSGGLGPTGDDITKESIAKALELDLKINDYELTKLKDHFIKRGVNYTEVNSKQALYTELDTILVNSKGTANGYYFTKDKTTYCVLPGPPNENRILMDEFSKTLEQEEMYEEDLYLINIGESSAEVLMEHLYQKYNDVFIGCYMQDFGINYRIKSSNKNSISACFNDLKNIFKDYYLCASDNPLNEFVKLLISNKLTISFAESCTAGLACSNIADIAGASSILNESLVTYSNEAKHKYLGVPWDLLNNYGAVSKECAIAMSHGLKQQTNSDINISITGIAGPDGGSSRKPVGLVHFAITYNNNTYHFEQNFNGNRNLIRTRAAKSIIFETYRIIQCTI